MGRVIVLGLILLFSASLHADSSEEKMNFSGNPKEVFLSEFEGELDKALLSKTDSPLQGSLADAKTEYDINSYKHRQSVFEWQHLSSIIIFWVVITIVLSGLLFSGMQFYISFKRASGTVSGKGEPDSSSAEKRESLGGVTEFEVSSTGFKVSSSVLGIVILVISLAFFYLYLTHVYPVNEIGGAQASNVDDTP